MAKKHILIVCGEASGDLHASNLAKKILELAPETKISGVGGPLLRQVADKIYYDIKGLSVMGLFDVAKKLPHFFSLKKLILEKIKSEKPGCIILVDFSGFNLRLAKAVNKSIPVIYYISPQVWASRRGRIETIKKYIHKMIVLFKFEEELYKKYGVDVELAGHPLLDVVKPTAEKKDFLHKLGFNENKITIALLPGSRKAEINNILPIMLKACALINKNIPDTQFIIAKSPQSDWETYNKKVKNLHLNMKIIEGKTYDCLNIADFSLVCSGTATLEAAIIQKPFAVVYKMNLLNYLLYRPQVKIPYISLVNILAKKMVVPEFIQFKAQPKNIAKVVLRFLGQPEKIKIMENELGKIKASLGDNGASLRTAQIILKLI